MSIGPSRSFLLFKEKLERVLKREVFWYKLRKNQIEKYKNKEYEYCEEWFDGINKEPFILYDKGQNRSFSIHFTEDRGDILSQRWKHDHVDEEFELYKLQCQLEFDFE
jgi:hypothetical protein